MNVSKREKIKNEMEPRLQAEVERQLMDDLRHYGVEGPNLTIEWWDRCGEGHGTEIFEGWLEEVSGLLVLDEEWNVVAEGWMDFIHGGGDNRLHVFWLFLNLVESGQRRGVKEYPAIPEHIWRRLSDAQRDLCTREGVYASRWANDPLVSTWKEKKVDIDRDVS